TFEVHLIDNKSVKRAGNVSSASAITRNLVRNLNDLLTRLAGPGTTLPPDLLSRVRQALTAYRDAVQNGTPLPAEVKLIVTGSGGQASGVTARLGGQNVQFRDVKNLQTRNPPGSRGSDPEGGEPGGPVEGGTGRTGRGGRLVAGIKTIGPMVLVALNN